MTGISSFGIDTLPFGGVPTADCGQISFRFFEAFGAVGKGSPFSDLRGHKKINVKHDFSRKLFPLAPLKCLLLQHKKNSALLTILNI